MGIRERYELAEELRSRYLGAGRVERGQLLDSFCLATGYERKDEIKVQKGRRWQSRRKQIPRAKRVRIGVPVRTVGMLRCFRLSLPPATAALPSGSGPDLGTTWPAHLLAGDHRAARGGEAYLPAAR